MVEIVDVLEALATMQEALVLRSLSCDTDLKTPCVTHQKKGGTSISTYRPVSNVASGASTAKSPEQMT